jgi:hypothetical protein
LIVIGLIAITIVASIVGGQGSQGSACQPETPGSGFEAANQRGLSGELSQNSYFKGGEEYTIADGAALTVPPDITLIIEPGARLKFGRGAKLIVSGKLLACGAPSRRIFFSADTTSGQPGYWAGIELMQARPGSVIGYATFEFAGRDNHAPLWIEDSDVQLEDLKFDGNQWYAISLDPDSLTELPVAIQVDNGPQGWEVRGGALTLNRTWSGEQSFIVNGRLEVGEKARLTIEPGVRVKFLPGSGLIVRGDLQAIGESGRRILFTSANDEAEANAPKPAAGDWLGLYFVGRKAQPRLEFVDVKYAGGEAQQRGCVWLQDAAPILKDVTIGECAAFSLSSDIQSELKVESLTLSESDLARRWELRESTLEGVTQRTLSKIEIGTPSGNAILAPVLTGWVGVGDKASLTIDAGVTLLFRGGERAGLWSNGKVQANGTQQEPVVLTSWRDRSAGGEGGAAPGDWGGFHLTNSLADETRIEHVEVRFAGANNVRCVQLKNASPTIDALTVGECASYPLSSDALSQPQLSGLALSDNPNANQWEIQESTLAERNQWAWSPLQSADGAQIIRVVTGRVVVEQEAALTLQSGLLLKFASNGGLIARGELSASGSADAPIILTSWRDPEGGGSESGAQPGDWPGVLIDGKQAAQSLAHVQIRYAGVRDQPGCLALNAAAPTLSNVTIADCANYPISSDLNSDPAVEGLTLKNNQPADEWALRESKLQDGAQRTLEPLTQADGRTSIVRTAIGWLLVEANARLTLEPGTILKFRSGTGLWIGGALIAEGAADQPIVLTSWRDPRYGVERGVQAGDWIGLALENAAASTRLGQVEIRYAGGERNPRGAVTLINSSPQLADVSVRDSAWYPLSIDAKSAPQLERLSFADNAPADAVEVRASTLDAPGEQVWSPWSDAEGGPLVRVVTGKVVVAKESTLRLDTGLVVKFDVNGGLEVRGGLLVTNTVLTSLHDDGAGGDTDGTAEGEPAWQGLRLLGRAPMRIEQATLRYAQIGVWMEDAAPQLREVRVEDSRTAAFSADLKSRPVISDVVVARNAINGLLVRVDGVPEGETRWGVLGGADNQLVRVVQGAFIVGPKSKLVIEPGVVVKFAAQSGVVIDGELQAGQASGSLVAFTSLEDDSAGGDTDGVQQETRRGSWLGIAVNPNNTNAKLSLNSVTISFGAVGLFLTDMPEWDYSDLTITASQLFGLSCDALSRFAPDDVEIILKDNGQETLSCPTPDR